MKKPSMEVTVGKLTFKNPVLVASGTFGYAKEFERFFDLKKLGGVVSKTITLKPRIGNPPQRVFETPAGMLNAIGLQNVGAEAFVSDKLPYLSSIGIPVIASVMGYSVEEFKAVVERLDAEKRVDGFELNLSCPNVHYDKTHRPGGDGPALERPAKMFAHDPRMIYEVVSSVRKITKKTIFAKLGPDVSDVGMMAIACEKGGADAVSLINTFMAMAIDVRTRKPVIKNKTGGLSGPCVRPIAVRMVWEAAKNVKIPICGMGGIMNWKDAAEFLIAGARCIQVGTANFVNPTACPQIVDGLADYAAKQKLKSIDELIGSLKED